LKVVLDGRVVSDRYPGMGRYAFEMARALAERLELILLVNSEAANTRYCLQAIPGRQVDTRLRPGALAAQWGVPRAVASSRADVYHSPYYLFPYGVRRVDCAVVVTLYDLIPLLPEAGYGPAARLAYRLAHLAAARLADRILVLSRWAAVTLREALAVEPSRVAIAPPAAGRAFCPQPAAQVQAVTERLGMPPSYALYVGAHRPHKNIARLLEAYGRLPHSAPPLVLAGRPDPRFPLPEPAAQRLAASGRLYLVGDVAEPDLPALYTGACLFVCPSLAEGFGLPVLEAMACGVPVACSTTPGLDEAAGDAAVRFDPRSVDDMADTLGGLLTDAARLEERRRRSAAHAASFSWERTASVVVQEYEVALAARRRP
jgi:alpha-1,3-rhamnosyl/mannosyltransferase